MSYDLRKSREDPEPCPSCGALPCDWRSSPFDVEATVKENATVRSCSSAPLPPTEKWEGPAYEYGATCGPIRIRYAGRGSAVRAHPPAQYRKAFGLDECRLSPHR